MNKKKVCVGYIIKINHKETQQHKAVFSPEFLNCAMEINTPEALVLVFQKIYGPFTFYDEIIQDSTRVLPQCFKALGKTLHKLKHYNLFLMNEYKKKNVAGKMSILFRACCDYYNN